MKGINISKTYQSILVIVIGFLLLYFYTKLPVFLYVAGVCAVLSLLSKVIAEKIHWLWMKLAWVLSLFMPKIILTVVFFLVLWPIASLAKLFGRKDPLALRKPSSTNFIEHQKTYQPEELINMW